jgi:hypothetical protein
MSGTRRNHRAVAEPKNEAASTAAVAAPPNALYRAAPASGPTIRSPDRIDSRSPFASPRSSGAIHPASRPDRAAKNTCCDTP